MDHTGKHLLEKEERHRCSVCQKTFRFETGLSRHKKTHFKCSAWAQLKNETPFVLGLTQNIRHQRKERFKLTWVIIKKRFSPVWVASVSYLTCSASKKLIETSRECHNHKQQPIPDTNRMRKRTKTNTYNTKAREAHRPAPSSPSELITMLKGMKHEDKEHRKTLQHEALRSLNNQATHNKNNTGTTALVC